MLILAHAKKMGLTFEELNEFTIQDFLDFSYVYTGKSTSGKRKATQEDIDRFFG